MIQPHIIEADLTWVDGRFASGIKIQVGENGRITDVGALPDPPTVRLTGHAVIPGLVNAHSHAFQRGLRGKGEQFPDGSGSFWSWREAMYELVASLDTHRFDELCEQAFREMLAAGITTVGEFEQAFREMLAAGITTVGEFHYMHHSSEQHDFLFDKRILDAANRAGIRITLLNAFYQTGGINRPLLKTQHRFETSDLDKYWAHMSDLEAYVQKDTQSLGVVAHSIRAVPIEAVCLLHDEAVQRQLPFHMHVEEQRQEIEECVREYGHRPMALLTRKTGIQGNFAAVHCTHSQPGDIDEFVAAGGRVVVCPLTEANLGDGIPHHALFIDAKQLSLGTDSNARISMIEEMRWLEYGQRLSREMRGALCDANGESATQLFEIATTGGAAALGIDAGVIRQGAYADFVAIDTTHPTLTHVDESTLLPALVFGSGNEAISDVCVGGQWLGIRHP